MRKPHNVGWSPDAPTPAQLKEFFSQIDSGSITKNSLQSFLASHHTIKNEEAAHEILGDDIIFPEEVAIDREISYTKAQLKQFENTIPSKDILYWCKQHGYAVVAGPPIPMDLLNVCSRNSDLFHSNMSWKEQPFASKDEVEPKWLIIRKEPLQNSFSKSWEEQLSLLSKHHQVPNAAEISWFITTFYEVRRVQLFKKSHVRTSSVSFNKEHIYVGLFDENGLEVIIEDPRDESGYYLGIAASLKS